MSLPPLVARLIGVGKYDREEYKHLHPEGDTNAKSLEKFLKNDPTLNRDIDIEMVIESVTRDNIFETLNELRNSVDRSKAIVVFFRAMAVARALGGHPSSVLRILASTIRARASQIEN
jgi:hypothetical protein